MTRIKIRQNLAVKTLKNLNSSCLSSSTMTLSYSKLTTSRLQLSNSGPHGLIALGKNIIYRQVSRPLTPPISKPRADSAEKDLKFSLSQGKPPQSYKNSLFVTFREAGHGKSAFLGRFLQQLLCNNSPWRDFAGCTMHSCRRTGSGSS